LGNSASISIFQYDLVSVKKPVNFPLLHKVFFFRANNIKTDDLAFEDLEDMFANVVPKSTNDNAVAAEVINPNRRHIYGFFKN
jgi:hypothetical protein